MDNWKNILDEDILKTNINFVAVFVMNYECLKEFVIERIRDFYSEHFYMDGDRIVCEESGRRCGGRNADYHGKERIQGDYGAEYPLYIKRWEDEGASTGRNRSGNAQSPSQCVYSAGK